MELIIAISIGVIVAGSIAALIAFSIRMYNNESVNTAMQYELQSNLNMMMDEIMGASAFVVEQDSTVNLTDTGKPYTKYAMFGNPNADIGGSKGFKGVIFVPSTVTDGKFSIYMKEVEAVPATTIKALAASESAGVLAAADKTPYLLGENATKFAIIPDPRSISFDKTDPDPTKYTYVNPIEVKVELQFEKHGWGSNNYSKHVDDTTYLRNKVTETIYVDTDSYNLKKKEE